MLVIRQHAVGSSCPSAEIQLPSCVFGGIDCIPYYLTGSYPLSEAYCVLLNEVVISFACQTHCCVLSIIKHHTFGSCTF